MNGYKWKTTLSILLLSAGVSFGADCIATKIVTSSTRDLDYAFKPIETNTIYSPYSTEFYELKQITSDSIDVEGVLNEGVWSRVGSNTTLDDNGYLWSYADHDEAIYERNTNFYAADIDFSYVSIGNSESGYKKRGVLITQQHVVFVAHYYPAVGTYIRFIDKHGNIYDRQIVDVDSLASGHDVAIGLLNVPVPITPAKTVPSLWSSYVGTEDIAIPIIGPNQFDQWTIMGCIGGVHTKAKCYIYGNEGALYSDTIDMDSGQPSFVITPDGHAALFCLWSTKEVYSYGVVIGSVLDRVNTAIALIDEGNGIITGLRAESF